LYADADNGYDAWSVDNTRVTQSDEPGVDAQESRAISMRFDYRGWERITLRSISTFLDADMGFAFDGDWGNPEFWGENGPYEYSATIGRRRRNLSQEFRLRGEPRPGGWVAAAYALQLRACSDFLDLYNGEVYRRL